MAWATPAGRALLDEPPLVATTPALTPAITTAAATPRATPTWLPPPVPATAPVPVPAAPLQSPPASLMLVTLMTCVAPAGGAALGTVVPVICTRRPALILPPRNCTVTFEVSSVSRKFAPLLTGQPVSEDGALAPAS